jgi:prepilin-type N-terminal cleavage/methylation domain-containing protein
MTRIQSNTKNESPSTQNGETGFTMIELVIVLVLTSILGIFVFQIVTSSLNTLITMRTRKERADDAVLVLEKISREVRAANDINSVGSNILIFKRADTGQAVKFIRNTATNRLRRQSAADVASLPGSSSSGNIVAENVSVFTSGSEAGSGSINRIVIDLQFSGGSEWETKIYPRNYGL